MTTLAFLGEFGDAIDYIFHARESQAGGAQVGGKELLPLIWTHLKLTAIAMALGLAVSAAAYGQDVSPAEIKETTGQPPGAQQPQGGKLNRNEIKDPSAAPAQPGGNAAIDGGAPGIGTSREPCGASSRGTEPSRPTV